MMLASVATATAPPTKLDPGFFTKVPDVALVQPDISPDALNTILTFDVQGMLPGERLTYVVPENPIDVKMLETGAIVATIEGVRGKSTMTLPPCLDGAGALHTDFKMIMTPATFGLQRDNDAEPAPGYVDDVEDADKCDATMSVWGNVRSLGKAAALTEDVYEATETDPETVKKTATTTVEAHRWSFNLDEDIVFDLLAIDPESDAIIGSVTDLGLTPSSDVTHLSETDVKAALQEASVTSLTLNGVLESLADFSKTLGVVDLNDFSADFVELGWSLREVETLTGDNAATVLDPDAKELALIDGGKGKIAFLTDPSRAQWTDGLVIDLKAVDSVKDTSIIGQTSEGLGRFNVDPDFGLLNDRFADVQELVKLGEVVEIRPTCEAVVAFCFVNEVPQIGSQAAKAIQGLSAFGGLANAGGVDLTEYAVDPGTMLWQFNPEKPRIFPGGIGNIEGVPTNNVEAPAVPCFTCGSPEIGDALYESFSTSMLGDFPVVVLSSGMGVLGMATSATSDGIGAIPLDTLKEFPLGLENDVAFRFVGEKTSVFSGTGIPSVDVTFSVTDLLGIQSSQYTLVTNNNGYLNLPMATGSKYTFVATHDDYEEANGAGTQSQGGKEYTMDTDDSTIAGQIRENSGVLGVGLIVLAGALYMYNKKKPMNKKGGRK